MLILICFCRCCCCSLFALDLYSLYCCQHSFWRTFSFPLLSTREVCQCRDASWTLYTEQNCILDLHSYSVGGSEPAPVSEKFHFLRRHSNSIQVFLWFCVALLHLLLKVLLYLYTRVFVDKVNSERESEILKSIKSQIGRVLYSSQKFLHKKPLSPLADDKQLTADIDTDTNVVSMIEQLRADMQINSRQINKSVTSMFQKMDGLDSRVALIHDYLTGVSVEIVS